MMNRLRNLAEKSLNQCEKIFEDLWKDFVICQEKNDSLAYKGLLEKVGHAVKHYYQSAVYQVGILCKLTSKLNENDCCNLNELLVQLIRIYFSPIRVISAVVKPRNDINKEIELIFGYALMPYLRIVYNIFEEKTKEFDEF